MDWPILITIEKSKELSENKKENYIEEAKVFRNHFKITAYSKISLQTAVRNRQGLEEDQNCHPQMRKKLVKMLETTQEAPGLMPAMNWKLLKHSVTVHSEDSFTYL